MTVPTYTPRKPMLSEGEDQQLNLFFKALSGQTRRDILLLLNERSYNVSEIVDRFELAQPTISRHLSLLKEANLVTDQRQGQHVVYRLRPDALLRPAEKFFDGFASLPLSPHCSSGGRRCLEIPSETG